jgi:hypothetical protein
MTISHAEKLQARQYAADHGCNYTTALRAVRQMNDPLSFRRYLEESDDVPQALRDAVRADPGFPGGRTINGIATVITSYEHGLADTATALEGYRRWLTQFGVIGRIVSRGDVNRNLAADDYIAWRQVAFDLSFPIGDDTGTINAYMDAIGASRTYRAVVAAERWMRPTPLDLEVMGTLKKKAGWMKASLDERPTAQPLRPSAHRLHD